MEGLRAFYRSHLRDTPFGAAARSLKRLVIRSREQLGYRVQDLPSRMRARKAAVAGVFARARQQGVSHGVDTSTRLRNFSYRARYVARYYRDRMAPAWSWLFSSRETSNFTQDLFAQETGRQFVFFREEPADHWYLGAGIGLSFR